MAPRKNKEVAKVEATTETEVVVAEQQQAAETECTALVVVSGPQLPASNEAEPETVVLERIAEESIVQPEAVLPNCAKAKANKAKPQPKMLRKISWIGTHPGKSLRIKRFHLYSLGMTLQHCKETDGLDHLDVLFYVEHGLMRLEEPSKEELAAVDKSWQKSNTDEAAA